jgi:hypothetical protein
MKRLWRNFGAWLNEKPTPAEAVMETLFLLALFVLLVCLIWVNANAAPPPSAAGHREAEARLIEERL